jgi:glycerol-3-phosphate dehydrogenase (NAD(P)+)
VELLRAKRVNEIYLPGFELPVEVEVTGALPEALAGAEIVLGVMPSAHAREVYRAMRPHLNPRAVFVSATKGLEPATHARISEIIAGEIPQNPPPRLAVLSGPSFAFEVARGDPTAVVLASADASLAAEVQEEFSGPTFRLYTNDDVIGTEIAGAVKNVIAIAAGACAGLGLGTNTTAALVTRMVAEGVGSAAAALELAQRAGVEMPITRQVHAVLTAGRATRDAIRDLMERRLKQE